VKNTLSHTKNTLSQTRDKLAERYDTYVDIAPLTVACFDKFPHVFNGSHSLFVFTLTRGEKIADIAERAERMNRNAENFANAARELRKQQERNAASWF
jgi:hypothetical protein